MRRAEPAHGLVAIARAAGGSAHRRGVGCGPTRRGRPPKKRSLVTDGRALRLREPEAKFKGDCLYVFSEKASPQTEGRRNADPGIKTEPGPESRVDSHDCTRYKP